MKLSAYREALLKLAEQVTGDYELQGMLNPKNTDDPFYGREMLKFAESVNAAIDNKQVLTAASLTGVPVPSFVALDTLPGSNYYAGAPDAPPLRRKTLNPQEAVQAIRSAITELKAQPYSTLPHDKLMTLLKNVLGSLGDSSD